LKMNDVHAINSSPSHAQLNTGSPHYVQWVSDVDAVDVVGDGRSIRYSPPFASEGINVNFAERKTGYIAVRTYERGVENETLSCGTGVTAVALAAATGEGPQETTIRTPGGTLNIRFCKTASGHFEEVWLCGPATFVFEGSLDLSNRRLS
ncbi:MAG TPA: diaminopimelate epimerase, partial [Lacibacter sp.]|nr:diaminopimelate epimerase [Lacibacter sp.]